MTTPRRLDDVFTFPHYETLAEWEETAAELRQHVLACTGLLLLPDKCPLNPRFLGRIERDGYVVTPLKVWTVRLSAGS